MREFLPRCFGRNPDRIEKQQNNVLSRKTVLRFPLNIFMFSLLYMGGLIGNKKECIEYSIIKYPIHSFLWSWRESLEPFYKIS